MISLYREQDILSYNLSLQREWLRISVALEDDIQVDVSRWGIPYHADIMSRSLYFSTELRVLLRLTLCRK